MNAYEDIRNLLGTYCEVMDAGDWDGLGSLFADGAITDPRGREIARGAEAVSALWSAMVRRYDGSPLTRHLVTGPIIHVDGDTATRRSSFLVVQKPPAGDLRLVAAGRYRDTFAATGGTWHFTERQFFLEQEGDMTQHMVDLWRFSGRRVLVTGAASGVGKATAALFAAEGASLVCLDRTPGPGITEIDLTDFPATAHLVRAEGPFDVVLNVAGMVRLQHVADIRLDSWQEQLDVNLTAPFVVSQAALPGLIERRGCIVNVASVAGLRGQAYSAAYCASKAGLVMLTKSMALELSQVGVRVNCVCPGGIDTPLIAEAARTMPEGLDDKLMQRLYNVLPPGFSQPDEIAEAIAYLASDAARSVTGTALSIDGGIIS